MRDGFEIEMWIRREVKQVMDRLRAVWLLFLKI